MRTRSSASVVHGRRTFLGTAAAAGLALLGAREVQAAAPEERLESEGASTWDLSWVNTLKGKHKQVFDCVKLDALPLITASNYLRAMKEVYGLEHPQVNVVMGIAGLYPVNANDAVWAKYALGEKWEVKDPLTGTWATRNVFLDSPGMPLPKQVASNEPDPAFENDVVAMFEAATIASLKRRGAIFWQCNNALSAVTSRLARATGARYSDVRKDLLDGLLPGVKLVPAHTMMLGVLQERGFTYEHL